MTPPVYKNVRTACMNVALEPDYRLSPEETEVTVAALSPAELNTLTAEVRAAYDAFKLRGLKLDMTRGKPAPEQLDLANGLLGLPGNGDYFSDAREDGRNYGGVQGLA